MHKTRLTNIFRPVYPSPAGLIVSIDENKNPNVMTAGEVFNIGLRNPTIIGIAIRKATYTYELILKSKQFTVNLPTVAILEKVDLVGTVTGRGGFNKFTAYGLTLIPSDEIDAPIIVECPVNLECKMLNVSEVGDHDLILGEVVAMHVDSDKLNDNPNDRQQVLMDKVDGFLFGEWGYYRIGEKLGEMGFSRNNR